jgi:arylsulfatase A-like enzyme
MLGQHTGHLNLRGNVRGGTLQADEVTVARLLQASGYHTGLIGKWGLADAGLPGVPQKQGFDEFVGYLENVHAHDYYPTYLWRYDPPSASKSGYDGTMVFPENENNQRKLYVPDLCTKAALNFIQFNKPDAVNRHRPFFLHLCYTVPHANNEEGQRSGNGMQVPGDVPYTHEPWPQTEKNKAAMITRMDADIGRILEKLKELKIEENTVVFFSSDNGPHQEGGVKPILLNSSGPLRGIKRDLTEGGIRVPMIVRWPGQIRPGQVSDFVWAAWDFLPTAADLALTRPPPGLDGLSVLPLLTGQTQTNRHEYLYWEFHERGFQQALRMGDWKAIRPRADAPLELYDLKADLGEKQNVAEQHPEVIAQIEKRLKEARRNSERWPIKKPEPKGKEKEADATPKA